MKVTIYSQSEFLGNIVKRESTLHEFTFRKYAQYPNALEIIHTPKRKRAKHRKIYTPCGGSPDILILEGWNNPEPKGMIGDNNQFSHPSFDSRFQSEFDTLINKKIEDEGLKIVLDTRGHEAYFKAIREHKFLMK